MKLIYGISTKPDGNMLVSVDGEIFAEGKKNRENFLKKHTTGDYAVAGLVHGTDIKKVSFGDNKKIIWRTDGLITDEKNLFLCLTGADCLPVYFSDEERGVVGIAHGGWRGIIGGIIENMILKMIKEFDCVSRNIKVILGPGIRSCHFEIKTDIINQFKKYGNFIINRNGKIFVDLSGIIKGRLLELKLLRKNIKDDNECTYCSVKKYFSNRRDKKEIPDVMLAYVAKK